MAQFIPAPLQNLLTKLVKEYISEQVNYLVTYEKNVHELDNVVDKLRIERDKVLHEVDEAENRYSREIELDVKEWLDGVQNTISEYDKFTKEEDREYAGCSHGLPPNPVIRYGRSRRAEDIAGKVKGLLETADHGKISYFRAPPSMGVAFSNVGYESFESRTETMDKIRAALEDSSVRMIGVDGLSGVGKTTLVIEVAKKALEDKLFDVVVMANVTRNPDIRKIQGQIADMLGMKLEEESEYARAVRINQRLKKEKENTLIILDDLWAKLDLNMLGIPSENNDGGGQKNLKEVKSAADEMKVKNVSSASNKMKTEGAISRYKGCKIILVSEIRQMLLSQMNGKGNLIFSVKVLNEKEARTFFKKMAGIDDHNSELKKLAVEIANKCKGLPMTVVTIAGALKNQSRLVWEDVHQRLEKQKLTGTPEDSIKLSYQYLENEELRYTFLLCARMSQDALIMDLVKYCIGLGFLQGIYTVREARDRVMALLVKLKQSSLLSDSYSSDRFTMQDIVRGAALSIASQEKHVFMMTKGKLDEWPDEDKLERYAAISLQHCDIQELPENMNCPKLRVFQVDNDDPHLKIPNKFFEGMKELRVLILTGIHLSPLPSSIRCLTKLRMLCLERCTLDKELDVIGELKKLRVLSFSGSDIKQLPAELKHLAKLQILDISNCFKLSVIPPKVISSLTTLEALYMRNKLIQWNGEEQENQSKNASLSELRHLNQLTNLDIEIPNVAHLSKNLFFDKLDNYKIVIGDFSEHSAWDFKIPQKYEAMRFLALQLKDGLDIHSLKGIKMLFERVEKLLLGELYGVQDIFHELNLKGFPYLKHLSIVSNPYIKYLINSMDWQHQVKAFPKLESLCLYRLKNMEQIWHSRLKEASFSKLKVIQIKLCHRLKNVFFFSMVGILIALETVEVSECNFLTEIVTVETPSNGDEEIKFPKLCCLTLQSLSEFIGFYNISPATEALFDEKVVVSKLERMELSSLKIHKIWSDQSLTSSYFQNLIELDVNNCWNLKYLLSFSVANSLVSLQSLFISKCWMMERIFNPEVSMIETKDSFFPKLKTIKLSSMTGLKEIWNDKVPLYSFSKLDSLIIEKCEKLENVFPSFMVEGFPSLSNLRVTNCKSMEEIFHFEDNQKNDAPGVTNLQGVHLEALPKLKHVWNSDPDQILNFKNLQKIWVIECPNLKNIFPVSMAKDLKELEYLGVSDCGRLEEIVAMGEHINTSIPFEFPKLTTIRISELPKLKSFCSGRHPLSWPALSDMSVEFCHSLEPFRTEADNVGQEITPLLPEEVIYNVKSMQIEPRDAKWLQSYIGDYGMQKLEELHLSRLGDTEILYFFLHRNPNMKSLWLDTCFFKELVPRGRLPANENIGVVPKLKSLKLINLPLLVNIGFERDNILQRIECLILEQCPDLVTVVPSSVSFAYLTHLEVANCRTLINLMAPSTAKSLGRLTTMKVNRCKSMKTIVSEEGNEEKIVFRQLKEIELVALQNLTSFCNSNSVAFEFPSLEKVVVAACGNMQEFSRKVESTPILRQIYVAHQKEDQRWHYWEGDLNATIEKIFNDKDYLEGTHNLTFTTSFHEGFLNRKAGPDNSLQCIKTLELYNCNSQSHAIPSDVLPCLKKLRELKVQNCSNVEVIFNMNDTEIEGTAFMLKKLTLEELPKLTDLWDKNPQETLSFQNLKEVLVTKCEKMRTVFPAAVAKGLQKLEKLDINQCEGLLDIVGKEEAAADATQKLFPRLTSLNLFWLPQLTQFCHEGFTLEWLELNSLAVLFCGTLELFQREGDTSASANGQSSLSDINVVSKLETLQLNGKVTRILCDEQFPGDNLTKLKELCLRFDDVNLESTSLFEFLQKTPNIEHLAVRLCSDLEFFSSPELEMLGHLKKLNLYQLFGLKSIGLEYSPCLNGFCERLHVLIVDSCTRLTTLVHSAVSFSNLRELQIQDCHKLEYVFTSQAAKKLMHLEEIYISRCDSLKQIFAKEQNEASSDKIKLQVLNKIILDSLPSLECFYSGKKTLQLPSLILVYPWQCPKMEIFSQGLIEAESLCGIWVEETNYMLYHHDLNAAVERLFLQPERLILRDSLVLRRMWLKEIQDPDRCFSHLKSLIVEGCQFLSNAVLPSYILPFLSNLEELRVRECDSVKAIFDVKDTPRHHTRIIDMGPASPPCPSLKKLTLEKLPSLEHVWNEDPQSASFPFLEEVWVEQCARIASLFPASVARDRLQKLQVEHCDGLVEIVANNKADPAKAMEELTLFPSLTLLRLWNLENLKCIYPGMHNLDWPKLKVLDIFHCGMLKIFVTKSRNSPDSHAEGQDCFPTDPQAFFSIEKVTPHLEQLSLDMEDTMVVEEGQLQVDLQILEFLKLQCFHNVKDAFPYVFLSKVPLPRLKKLQIVDSAFQEIFPSQEPDMDCSKILSQLKELELNNLHVLGSIGLEHSWMGPFLEILETFIVVVCDRLENLAPSTVSFSHLEVLQVSWCQKLKYLFTSSTAKSLAQLKKMYIMDCRSIEEILAKEGNEPDEDEMIFGKLEILSLSLLPNLESFYKGSSTLKFPSLKDASFTQCHKMKIFSHGDIVSKKLTVNIDGVNWEDDLNTVIKRYKGGGNSQS